MDTTWFNEPALLQLNRDAIRQFKTKNTKKRQKGKGKSKRKTKGKRRRQKGCGTRKRQRGFGARRRRQIGNGVFKDMLSSATKFLAPIVKKIGRRVLHEGVKAAPGLLRSENKKQYAKEAGKQILTSGLFELAGGLKKPGYVQVVKPIRSSKKKRVLSKKRGI